jgi:hypothetical protein
LPWSDGEDYGDLVVWQRTVVHPVLLANLRITVSERAQSTPVEVQLHARFELRDSLVQCAGDKVSPLSLH